MNKKDIVEEKKKIRLKDRILNYKVVVKLKQLLILSCSFGYAFVDVFKSESKVGTFKSLSPVKNADKDGIYCKGLKWALEDESISNIAITGIYGAGKSSVIKTFFDKLENCKYNPIYISLGAFNKQDLYLDSKDKDIDHQIKNEFYHTLEKSILQQLLYQVKGKDVPMSRFKRIAKISRIKMNIISILSLITIISLICFIFPNIINIFNSNYNNILNYTTHKEWIKILVIVMCLCIYYFFYKMVFFSINKLNISRFKIKDAEIEITNKSESIFNKYLDEIIYFFQVTNHSVVVIEDLDRYDGDSSFIFQKLRELNTLINSSNQIKYKVSFIYAIKDDFFTDFKERTKFFDFIMPVLPISSNNNSNEIIWERLEKLKKDNDITYKFDKKFIDDIAIHLDDRRLIENIINEFIIYKNKINGEYKDDKQLFSIVMYKNLNPINYAQLQEGKGNIVTLFNNKKNIVESVTQQYKSKKYQLNEYKERVQKEKLQNIKELKHILISTIYDYSSYIGYERYFKLDNKKILLEEFLNDDTTLEMIQESKIRFGHAYNEKNEEEVFMSFGNKSNFLERGNTLIKTSVTLLADIQSEINIIQEKINNIEKMSVSQLLKFETTKETLEGLELLERFLISRGYIDEEYKDYITLFIPGNLSRKDYDFIFAVKNNEMLPYEYKLDKIDKIVDRLSEADYESSSILNYSLLNYLLKTKKNMNEIIKIINVIDNQDKNVLNFIEEFINSHDINNMFVNLLIEKCKNIWNYIYTSKLGDNNFIDKWVIRYLKNEKSLSNINDDFKNYVKTHAYIDTLIDSNDIASVIENIKKLNIKLENIIDINNKEFMEQIYLNNLYKLNIIMIKAFLKIHNINIEKFDNMNMTIIFDNNIMNNMKKYILADFNEYFNNCYTLLKSDTDIEKIIVDILNENKIKLDHKLEIIKSEQIKFSCIDLLPTTLYKCVLEYDRLEPSYGSILCIYKHEEQINDNVISHMDTYIEEYSNSNIDDLIVEYEDEIELFKMEYIYNEKVSIESFKKIFPTFNIDIPELQTINSGKLTYLIENNKVEFNSDNFIKIEEINENMIIKFISLNIEKFINNIDNYDIESYKEDILETDDISKENKVQIVNKINVNDLSAKLLSDLILQEIVGLDNEGINNKVLISNIELTTKLSILTNIVNFYEIETSTKYIHLLGANYKWINTSITKFDIPYTNDAKKFCDLLENKKIISSSKMGKNKNIIIYNRRAK